MKVLISSKTTGIILKSVYLKPNVSAIIGSTVCNPHLSKLGGRNK